MSSSCEPNPPVLGQKYRLIHQLDSGGMGSVWLAEAMHLSSLVAVKVMDRALTATPEAAERFLREARTAASLRSPHVVQILDYGVHDGTPFMAMELLEGESLASRLSREGRLGSWEQTELVLRHVARALARAHGAGVIHRDLKPGNIFLVRDDDEEIVKLLDFGIAKTTLQPLGAPLGSHTRTGEFLGSPAYASPEQLQGSKALDHRADIWSLGVIAFECLLGSKPFASDSFVGLLLAICTGPLPVPSEHGPVPAGFDAWFARACAREVELRFQSVREASAELKRLFAAATGSEPALPGAETTRLLPEMRAPSPASNDALAPPRPPWRTDTVPQAALPGHAAARGGTRPEELAGDTAPLVARGLRVVPRRPTPALWAALGLAVVVALVFLTLEASTLRAALDWGPLQRGQAAPSEATRDETPARIEEPARAAPDESHDAPAPSAGGALDPAPATEPAPSPAAAANGSNIPASSVVPPSRVPPSSDEGTRSALPPRPPSSAQPSPPRAPSRGGSAPTRLTITASAPAEVWLDGIPLGRAPLEAIDVEPGRHEVSFVHDGQRSVETLDIRSGEHKRVEARIGEAPGHGLDEAAVKRTIKANRDAVIDACWDDAFGARAPGDPSSVRVPVTITVEPSGSVQSVLTAAEPAGYPQLRRCIERRVSAWRFPSARAETVVSVAFVFVLK